MMERDWEKLIGQMTLEEKAGMCSGADSWHLKGVERLGIPSVMVSDGPHGLRKQDQKGDHLGINDSIPAVCFPAACATACSFDRDLLYEMGAALGDECQAEDVAVLLGPAVNIKRSPLCGRNFEYFSEDPYLASQMASAHIRGVQSKNASTSLKHFAANNQEYRRMSVNEIVDERTLREIYLAAFEEAVKEGKPDTVMCSYNKINGEFASENNWLLTEVLRKEWGFSGYVMSDWGAVNDRVKGLAAGLDLEMPGSGGVLDREIVEAVKNGSLPEAVLDQAVERILRVIFKFADRRRPGNFDRVAHHALAKKIEEESLVLLKNEGLLPLPNKGKKIVFIGIFAESPRFQGGGSSHINACRITSALEAAADLPDISYVQGYGIQGEETDEDLCRKAVEAAAGADAAVIFAGLPDSFESEGYDRNHMRLPKCQDELIARVAAVQPDTAVVLHNGSPVEMPWADQVNAVLEAYLGGQAVGAAVVDALFGKVNPSGKLAETFPYRLEDNPSYLNFPGDGKTVEYREGVFIGYRYYDTKKMPVRYPFGHGLSYTTFAYSDLCFSAEEIWDTEELTVSVRVKNTGKRRGKEVIQLYVSEPGSGVLRPEQELKNFEKVELLPGEEKTVEMKLNRRSFAWYNEQISDWYVSGGNYEIRVGASSRDIRLTGTILVHSSGQLPFSVHANTTVGDLMANPKTNAVISRLAENMIQRMTGDSTSETAAQAITPEMQLGMMENMPLRAFRSFAGFTSEDVKGLVAQMNQALEEK